MKPHTAEMHEGPEAFERFRQAVKKIVSVPKGAVVEASRRNRSKKPSASKG